MYVECPIDELSPTDRFFSIAAEVAIAYSGDLTVRDNHRPIAAAIQYPMWNCVFVSCKLHLGDISTMTQREAGGHESNSVVCRVDSCVGERP